MGGYIPEEPRNRIGCCLAWVWLPLAMPFLLVMALGGFGCEGAPQPCTPNMWQLVGLVAVVALLAFATSWATKTLTGGRRGPLWYVAALVALLLLVALAAALWWASLLL